MVNTKYKLDKATFKHSVDQRYEVQKMHVSVIDDEDAPPPSEDDVVEGVAVELPELGRAVARHRHARRAGRVVPRTNFKK